MPLLSANPARVVPVYLSGDADLPDGERAVFQYRNLSISQMTERAEHRKAAADAQTDDEYLPAMTRAVAVGLVGWQRLADHNGEPIPYDPANVAAAVRALTPGELVELYDATRDAMRLSPDAKKNCDSPAKSPQASAAPNAETPGGA